MGSRAPSPYEVRLEMRSGPPETATIRPFTVADGGSRSQRKCACESGSGWASECVWV